MPQLPVAGERAVFDIRENFWLEPQGLWLLHVQCRRPRLETLRKNRDLPLLVLAEAALNLACIDEPAILPPAEIDAVELAGLVGDTGDDEGVALAARNLGPR